MSASKVSWARSLSFLSQSVGVQKRFVHRSPDRKYVPLWNTCGHNFMESMGTYDKRSESNAGKNMYQSPELVEKIMQVFVVAKEKGFVPFLHAMPASAKVPMKAAELIFPFDRNQGPYFKYLRNPRKMGKSSYDEVMQMIPREETRVQKPEMLSMSYALTSGIRHLESAASWGFVNHYGKEQYFPMINQFDEVMQESGIENDSEAYALLKTWGTQLIRKYNRLKVGDFLVIGIPPEIVERFAYDSKPFNIPTGKKVLDVVSSPENHTDTMASSKTHMATMLMYNETLDLKSGLSIVNSSDDCEVASFCRGFSFKPMREVKEYKELTSSRGTDFEKNQKEIRNKLDQELGQFLEAFQELRVNPLKASSVKLEKLEDSVSGFDFPENLP